MKANLRVISALACVVLVGACFAQGQGQGRRRGGGGASYRQLLHMDTVRTELKLTDDEISKIDALPGGGGNRGGGGGGPAGGGGGGPRAFDPAAMEARREEEAKAVQAILTPDQFTRLHELLIQREGVAAVNHADVQTALGLSDDQKAKIKDLNAKFMQASADLRAKTQSGEMDRQAAGEARRENTKRLHDALTAVLTPDQQTKLAAMGGAKFDFGDQQGGR